MPEKMNEVIGESSQDNLLGGGVHEFVTDSVTLKSGQAYMRGTVLGVITASGLAVPVNSTAVDGSQNPYAILSEDKDATLENTPAAVYLTGEFNETVLIFGGTDTFTTHKRALREIGIFLKDVVKA